MHLLGGVDAALAAGSGPLLPLHLLLLHETVVARVEAELDEAAARVVAGTLVRCLAGETLWEAVEEFCAEWGSRLEEPPVAPATSAAAGDGEASSSGDAAIDLEAWTDCIISEQDLRPEAFESRTWEEQRRILREMFGDSWTAEDERELAAEAA